LHKLLAKSTSSLNVNCNVNSSSESIKAEEQRAAEAQSDIEALERKKRNLLVITTGLNALNSAIENGDTNAFTNVSNSLTSFLSGLPKFFDGTSGTVAEALGHTGRKDAHTVRVHDNEHIIGARKSDQLHAAGFSKTDDIVNAALMYQADQTHLQRASVPLITKGFDTDKIVNQLSEVKQQLKELPKNMPVTEFQYDAVRGILSEEIKKGNLIINNKHSIRGRLS